MKKRRRIPRLDTLLTDISTPVFLLDAQRRFQFFNRGCEELTGWSAQEIVGTSCEYDSSAEPGTREALAESICPPPEVYGGRPASVPAYIAHRDQSTAARILNFIPLLNESNRVTRVLAFASPIEQSPQMAETSAAQELHAELAALRGMLRQRYGIRGFVARSVPMQRVLAQLNLALGNDLPVLFLGAPGTGKEHAARVLHYHRAPAGHSFIPIDCRRLDAIDLKQTLRRVLRESGEASGDRLRSGALYLADVGDLARDLQEMIVEHFAAKPKERAPNLRLLAGLSGDPRELLEREVLRPDFYYLLTALQIEMPPLRDRAEDLPVLAQAFLEQSNRGQEKQIGGFADEVWKQLREYDWPGNLDELAAVVAEAWEASRGDLVRAGDLPFRFRTGLDAQIVAPRSGGEVTSLEQVLSQTEAQHIQLALDRSGHNKSKAAKLLGIPRAKLYRRMQALGIADLEGRQGPEFSGG